MRSTRLLPISVAAPCQGRLGWASRSLWPYAGRRPDRSHHLRDSGLDDGVQGWKPAAGKSLSVFTPPPG